MRYESNVRTEGDKIVWSLTQIPDPHYRVYIDPTKCHVIKGDDYKLTVLNPGWATMLAWEKE